MNNTDGDASLTRYFGMFIAFYIVLLVLLAGLALVSDNGFGGVKIMVPFLCAQLVIGNFFKHERRVPNPREQTRLLRGSLVIIICVELLLAAIGFMADGAVFDGLLENSTLLMGVAVILLVVVFIDFLLLRWAYGSLAEKQFKKWKIKNNVADTFD